MKIGKGRPVWAAGTGLLLKRSAAVAERYNDGWGPGRSQVQILSPRSITSLQVGSFGTSRARPSVSSLASRRPGRQPHLPDVTAPRGRAPEPGMQSVPSRSLFASRVTGSIPVGSTSGSARKQARFHLPPARCCAVAAGVGAQVRPHASSSTVHRPQRPSFIGLPHLAFRELSVILEVVAETRPHSPNPTAQRVTIMPTAAAVFPG